MNTAWYTSWNILGTNLMKISLNSTKNEIFLTSINFLARILRIYFSLSWLESWKFENILRYVTPRIPGTTPPPPLGHWELIHTIPTFITRFSAVSFQQFIIFCEESLLSFISKPAGNYMFKVNNRNPRTRSGICSKLTIKTPERRHWRRSGVFIVNFEHTSHLILVFLLLTVSR